MAQPIVDSLGTRVWRENGKLHRLDGPAVIYPNGIEMWYKNGKLHRLDGPAVESADGSRWWYENDKRIPQPTPIKL
jgi:hypothetical protein